NGRVVLCAFRCLLLCSSHFEATRFLSRYCGALCFIFCQVIIKDCPHIYSSFSSSTECLNLSHHITFVRASLACLGISGSGGGIDTGPGNIEPMNVHTSLEKKT